MRRPNVVLAYHAIEDCPAADDPDGLFVTADSFAAQMKHLARTGRARSLDEVLAEPGRGHIAVTFDDAYRNVLTRAAPILRGLRIPATVFVPTGHLGTTNSWVPPRPCDLAIMTEEDLVAAAEELDLQSHGHGHIDFARASPEEAERDVLESLDVLERITGARPRYFAYPWGRFTHGSAAAVARTGIEVAFSIYVPAQDDARESVPIYLAADRVPITRHDGMTLFRAKISGRYLAIRRSRAMRAGYAVARPVVRRVLSRG